MIILIQGPPSSGKTTLGNGLSNYFGIPHFSKYEIKESLFNTLGTDDSDWSRKLGISSNDLLFLLINKYISSESNVIIETNITSTNDREKLRSTLLGHDQKIFEVFLDAPKLILMDRFKKRWDSGTRHSGHVDDQRYKEVEEYVNIRKARPTETGNKFIMVNTEEENAISVLNIVVAELESIAFVTQRVPIVKTRL